MARPRWLQLLLRIWTIEDVIWWAWLLVLSPAAGGLFLEGGRATIFLSVAAIAFALAMLTGDGVEREARPYSMLLGIGSCIILIDAGFRQLHAPNEFNIALAIITLQLVPMLWWQHRRGRPWIRVRSFTRRVLVWPYLMVAAEQFSGFAEGLVGPSGLDPASKGSVAEEIFVVVLIYAGVLPLIFFAFVAAPRRVVHRDDEATFRGWVLRYLLGLATALVSTYLVVGASGGQ
jgi:hypothetical protein